MFLPARYSIEAKIYSVDLSHAFSSDVYTARCSDLSSEQHSGFACSGSLAGGTTTLSAATLVGKSRELLGAVTLMETREPRQNSFLSLRNRNR